MKILLLGATGRTGKLILEELLAKNFEVNVLVRSVSKIEQQSKKLKIFEGNPTILKDLEKASEDCIGVINALNISRTSDFPWARLRTPKDFLAKTMENFLKISFERIIIISAWGVAETRTDIPFWFSWLIQNSNIKYGYLGHEQQEKLLENSAQSWTTVRPVGLTNSNKLQKINITMDNFPKPKLTISRKSVAKFIVEILEKNSFINQNVTISAN